MQCQLFRTETSKAVLELNYDYICVKAGTGRALDYGNYRTHASRTLGYNLWNWASDPANHLAPHNKSNWLWKAERAALEQQRWDSPHNNLLIWTHFPSQGQRKFTASLSEERTDDPGKHSYTWSKIFSGLAIPTVPALKDQVTPGNQRARTAAKTWGNFDLFIFSTSNAEPNYMH